jgi:hypothetical protein
MTELPSGSDSISNGVSHEHETAQSQTKRPTLATLFQPGYWVINREIMLNMDVASFQNLRRAVQGGNSQFSRNLRHRITLPKWDHCHGNPTTGGHAGRLGFINPCDGFRLGLESGLSHGPLHGICSRCDRFARRRCLFDEYSYTLKYGKVPYRRMKHAHHPPTNSCNCKGEWKELNLCDMCRRQHCTVRRLRARAVALEERAHFEYITARNLRPFPHTIRTTVGERSCEKCDRSMTDPHAPIELLRHNLVYAQHINDEPLQWQDSGTNHCWRKCLGSSKQVRRRH